LKNILLALWRKFRTQANAATMSSSEFGRWAEKQAERFLKKEGFKILARNFRAQRGELDIVALDSDEVVFVEVKAVRDCDAEPQRKVDAHKRKCLAAAARFFIMKHHMTDRPARFDIITIKLDGAGQKQIEHEPNAFQAE
jgi:putative endonuclease